MHKEYYDCIIVGGGATGAGIARDLSLRGLTTLLIEKNDLSEGTTGRCHAMLHSGARYVFKDIEAAKECAEESKILLSIAPHITELCRGFFIGISDEDIQYGDLFEKRCEEAQVGCDEISVKDFLAAEPNCNEKTRRVFSVNDGYVDPFLLTFYNAYDAKQNGAKIKTYCKVESLILKKERIVGVKYYDKLKKKSKEVYGQIVINATGPWASYLEKDLELKNPLSITPTMGTLLVIKDRLVNHLINRLRKPGDGDILVPSHQSVILGTTSKEILFDELDNLMTNEQEIEYLLKLGENIIPKIRKHRLIRFYSGARPLIASGGPSREASRKFEIIDYESEGYTGLITIFGGKLTTYRLMAEKTCDLVCQKLGRDEICRTSELSLPGGEKNVTSKIFEMELHVDSKTAFDMHYKWGTFYQEIFNLCDSCLDPIHIPKGPRMVCQCENVTEPELKWTFNNLDVKTLDDYRRRTRQGMGPCQGQFCYYKIANLEAKWTEKSHDELMEEMRSALEKRWKIGKVGTDMIKRQIKLSKYIYLFGGGLG